MVERYEIDQRRRFDAGVEAIEVLTKCGFGISDFDISTEEPRDCHFTVEAKMAIGEDTDPLDALEDEDDEDLGEGFALGFLLGLTVDG